MRSAASARAHSSVAPRARVLAAALIAAVCLLVAGVAAASAAVTVFPSKFEGGDGNLQVNTPGNTDWESFSGTLTPLPDGSGAGDSQYAGGAQGKEQDPGSWLLNTGTVSPGKSDILEATTRADVASGDIFLYAAFQRMDGSGNANVSFELNQLAPPNNLFDNDNNATTPAIPKRTEGDLLITFDGNNSNGVTVGMCKWHGDERGESSSDPAHNSFGWYTLPGYKSGPGGGSKLQGSANCTPVSTTVPAQAAGAMNNGVLHNDPDGAAGPLDKIIPNMSADIGDNLFGEMSVDLSAALKELGQPTACFNFGSVWMHSRSSDTPTSNMIDYVSPQAIQGAVSCGISVDKTVAALPAGQTPDNSTVYHAGTPADPSFAQDGDTLFYKLAVTNTGQTPIALDKITDAQCSLGSDVNVSTLTPSSFNGDSSTGSFDPGDTWTFACSHPFTSADSSPYTNTVVVDGHGGATSNCPVHPSATPTLPCVGATDSAVTSRLPKLTVIKHLSPSGDPGLFNLQIDGATAGGATDVTDGGTTGAQFESIGNHTVSEAAGTGTSLGDYQKSIDCVDGGGQGSSVAATPAGDDGGPLTVALAAGDDVVCTITNVRETGTLTVEKDLTPANDGGKFNLQIDNSTAGGASNVGDGGTTGGVTVNTGSHNVRETAGTGTSLTDYQKSIECRTGGGSGSIVASTAAGADDGGNLSVPVAYGADIKCVISNVADGKVHIVKVNDGGDPADQFGFGASTPLASNSDTTPALQVGGTFALKGGDTREFSSVKPNSAGDYTVGESVTAGYRLVDITCDDGSSAHPSEDPAANAAGLSDTSATINVDPGEDVTCTFTNKAIHSSTVVVKAGDEHVYHDGTMSFTFTVTNTGDGPLHDITISDSKCPNVQGPAKVEGPNDSGASFLDPGDVWTYTCSMPVPAHQAGEENPVVNVVTVGAKDEFGRPVGDTDQHSTRILHPQIAIDKTGPVSATQGDPVPYTLNVTNPGDESFAASTVVVTDAQCAAAPVVQQKSRGTDADATPDSLDPGDSWVYTCSVQSQAGQSSITNTGCAQGADQYGRQVNACDDATTPLATQQVLGDRPVGTARLAGLTGCVARPFYATVVGKNIKQVVFRIDGRKRATISNADTQGRYKLRVDPRKFKKGSHLLEAQSVFTQDALPAKKSMKLRFARCVRRTAPAFTG